MTIQTFCYTNVCGLYNVYIICTHPALRSIYTQCVISHTLCNLCVLFYFYTNQVCFYTQCVVLHTFLLLGPINLDLRYFVAKSVFVIYAFFGVNFILRKFCLCKRNDKYEVWSLRVFSLAKSLSGPPQEPRAKVVQNYVKIDSQVENQRNIKWLTGSEGKLSPKLLMRFMFHALSNGMGWKWRQTHAIWQ